MASITELEQECQRLKQQLAEVQSTLGLLRIEVEAARSLIADAQEALGGKRFDGTSIVGGIQASRRWAAAWKRAFRAAKAELDREVDRRVYEYNLVEHLRQWLEEVRAENARLRRAAEELVGTTYRVSTSANEGSPQDSGHVYVRSDKWKSLEDAIKEDGHDE